MRISKRRTAPGGQALLIGLTAIACVALVWLFHQSRLGQAVDAVAADSVLASAAGIHPRWIRLCAFCFAGALAGVGGGLFAHYTSYVDPNNFSLHFGIHAVAYTLIGGIGTVFGPVLGTIVDVVFLEWLRVFGGYRMVIFGALIVIMMIWRPQGLLTRKVVPLLRKAG